MNSMPLLFLVFQLCTEESVNTLLGGIGKFPDCYCCNCFGEKTMRVEAKVTLPQAYCISLPRDTML
jgi:hypothetical protein